MNVDVEMTDKTIPERIAIYGGYSVLLLIAVFAIGMLIFVQTNNSFIESMMSVVATLGIWTLVLTPMPLLVSNYKKHKISFLQLAIALSILIAIGVGSLI